jgi:hypothetical protein
MPEPFGSESHKTEPTATAILMHWMRNIIEGRRLDLGLPDVETIGADRKRPDTVICESRRSNRVLCVIEAKAPYWDVLHEDLKDDARKKANKRGANYFATTNFKTLIWWKTEEANKPNVPDEQQVVERYQLSEIENLDDIEQVRYAEPIKRALGRFLEKLLAVHTGREVEPVQPIDEFLVFLLHEEVRVLSRLPVNHRRPVPQRRCLRNEAQELVC